MAPGRRKPQDESLQGLQLDQGLLIKWTDTMARLDERVGNLDGRLDRIEQAQQQLAAGQGELYKENAEQHQATARELGALAAGVQGLKERVGAVEEAKRAGATASKKVDTDPVDIADKRLTFVKKWILPGLFAVGAVIWGAIDRLLNKGGSTP